MNEPEPVELLGPTLYFGQPTTEATDKAEPVHKPTTASAVIQIDPNYRYWSPGGEPGLEPTTAAEQQAADDLEIEIGLASSRTKGFRPQTAGPKSRRKLLARKLAQRGVRTAAALARSR